MVDLLEAAISAGGTASEIPRKRGWALLQAWREIYCAPVHEATGKWTLHGLAWHTFSHGYFPCLKSDRALCEYRKQSSTDLLVLPDDDHCLGIHCSISGPLELSALSADVYVGPSSFEWTMVFTHEHPNYGPYFSRADWHNGIS